MKVAIFGRTIEHSSLSGLIDVLNAIIRDNSVETVFYKPFFEYVSSVCPDFKPDGVSFFTSFSDLPQDTGLFLSLGGDGTFLSSVPLVRDTKIPVAGINFGRLGFLTTSKAEELHRLMSGGFSTQPRTLLKMEYEGMPDGFYPYALNEFSIQRNGPAVLELEIKIDGAPIPKYMADGVLVASATGSTAYSMSAGGPIVMPGCRVLIVVPVAPHNLNIRPLVVSDNATIEVTFSTRYKDATLNADNRSFPLPNGAKVKFTSSSTNLETVSAGSDFIRTLSQKLYWGADWRNSL